MQTMTTFRNPLMGTRHGPPLVRGPQFENHCSILSSIFHCKSTIGQVS